MPREPEELESLNAPPDPAAFTAHEGGKGRVERRVHEEPPGLSITSLMDMMTIMLVYLLVSISSDPFSIKENEIMRLSRSSANFPALYTVPLQVNKKEITVDGKRALPVRCTFNGRPCSDDDYGRAEASFSIDPVNKENGKAESLLVTPLKEALVKKVQVMREQNAGLPEEIRKRYMASQGAATIVADRDMPYRLIAEVVYTVGAAELGDIRFAVAHQGGGFE